MRWKPGGRSENLEDRRGQSIRRGGMGLGIGGVLIVLLLSVVFKTDFFKILGQGGGTDVQTPAGGAMPVPQTTAEEEQLVDFVSFVLDDVQGTWTQITPALGAPYQPAKLVLFRDVVESACGFAESASGPFYCPVDQSVYVDLGFYDALREGFGAPGDFAQAYVLAHEIGHHVQRILGIEPQVRRAMQENPQAANELSVRLELQADCFAGVWGHAAAQRGVLEPGDLEEGLNAAGAIGDDRIQAQTSGRVRPESWTHGSSEQRVEWLRRGLQTGDCQQCDTFSGTGL